MARRVSLPAPNLNPFGGEVQSFGEYEVLDSGREKGIAFQKAQAAWAAGKISDEAYLGAYAKYVGTLPKNSSQRINAEEGLARERYTLGRNVIQSRIDAGDESAWYDLLAFDRASLSGRTTSNDETRRRQGYLRSTQQSIFTLEWNKKVKAVQQQRMTATQLRSWLQGQLRGDLTTGNAALQTDIGGRIDDLTLSITEERREDVFRQFSDGEMDPGEFLVYARTQIHQFAPGTDGYKLWSERLEDARLDVAEANLVFRWELSQQYHANQQQLQAPAPDGKGSSTRKVLGEDGWKLVPVEQAPTEAEQGAYADWVKQQEVLQGEQRRIERAMGSIGGQFVTPGQMVEFYKQRQRRVSKGTTQWFALQEKVGTFQDTASAWDAFSAENGYFPVITAKGRVINKTQGRALPGEGSVTVSTFMRALGSMYGGKAADKEGNLNRFGVTQEQWKSWAQQYLGDASAQQTPKNMEAVVRSKLTDLQKQFGSWALVADWWANGSHTGNSTMEWSGGTRSFVDSVWRAMGLGPLPSAWTFDPSQYASKVKLSPFGGSGQGGGYDIGRFVPAPQQQGGFGDGWGYRTDSGSGASLGDVSAGAAGFGVKLTDQNISWGEFKRRLANGESAVVNGLMSEVRGTGLERFGVAFANTGSESRHSVHVIRYKDGKMFWQDPLRPEGSGKGEWVDEDVVLRFAMGFSADPNDLAVAMSNQRVEHIPNLVDEHEAGPWTGCAWASTAMLVNGVKGRRVAEMEDVRWRGESGRWAGSTFDAPYGGATTAELRKAALQGTGGKARNKEKFPKTDGAKVPTTPGPQAGTATYQWGKYDPNAAIGGSYGNPSLRSDMGESQPRRGVGESQLQIITGPATSPGGDPRLASTTAPRGMGPSEFDSLYDRAQNAFLSGAQSFVAYDSKGTLVNYWFPHEGPARLQQMMVLDEQRVQLRELEWRMAEANVKEEGDTPSAERLDALAESRERHLKALDEMGTNYFAMLFMEDSFREEEPVSKTNKQPEYNVNPGQDIKRIATIREQAIKGYVEMSDRYIAAGDYTRAYVELQKASDIAATNERDLDALTQQLQAASDSQTAQGRQPSEAQRTQIEDAANWRETFKFGTTESPEKGTLLGDIDERASLIREWVNIDPTTKAPIMGVDSRLQMRPGATFVLNHNQGGPDTLSPQYLDTQNSSGGAAGGIDRHLPGHLTGSVNLMGRSVVAEIPYAVGTVGVVRLEGGGVIELKGKIINVNIDNRHQVLYENPFKPGRFSMVEDAAGMPKELVFDGPPGLGGEVDEKTGMPLLTWKDGSSKFTLNFNSAVAAYEVIETPDSDPLWFFNDKPAEPTNLGLVSANDDLRAQISNTFARDTSAIPRDQLQASDMDGATVGMSPQQFDTWVFNNARRTQYQRLGIARASAQMRYIGTPAKPYDPQAAIGGTPTRTTLPATSTPDAVKQMAAERQRVAAQATPKPMPQATPLASQTPKPVATPAPTPQATAPKTTPKPIATPAPKTYDPQASIGGGTVPMTSVTPEATQGRTTYLGGGR